MARPPAIAVTAVAGIVRVAIYVRLSKDEKNTLAVDRQEKAVRELLDRIYGEGNYEVAIYSDNGVSAWSGAKRPDYLRLLADCRANLVDAIGVWASDRLYRRLTDLETLIQVVGDNPEFGIQIHTAKGGDVDLSTSDGRLKARIMAAVAQQESDRKSERIRAARDQANDAGIPPNGPGVFGYCRSQLADGTPTLAIVEPEAEAVRFLAGAILDGASQGTAADMANDAGYVRRSGKAWTGNAVRQMLLSPTLAGLMPGDSRVAHGKVRPKHLTSGTPGNWPAILDRSAWADIAGELTDPARKHTRKRGDYWLRGYVFDRFGTPMIGGRHHDGRRVYKTTKATIDADLLENFLETATYANVGALRWETDDDDMKPTPEALKVRELETLLGELAEERGRGEITATEYRRTRAGIVARLEAAKAALPARSARRNPKVRADDLERRWTLPTGKGGLTARQRHDIVCWALGEGVTVLAGSRGPKAKTQIAERLVLRTGPLAAAGYKPEPASPAQDR